MVFVTFCYTFMCSHIVLHPARHFCWVSLYSLLLTSFLACIPLAKNVTDISKRCCTFIHTLLWHASTTVKSWYLKYLHKCHHVDIVKHLFYSMFLQFPLSIENFILNYNGINQQQKVKQSHNTLWRHRGSGVIAPTYSCFRHKMGVSGQSHAPVAFYPRGKDPCTHWIGGLVSSRAGLNREARGKIPCPSGDWTSIARSSSP
jgi:hypothetical protein